MCLICKKEKYYTNDFYLSNNVLHVSNNNRFPYCKDCLKAYIDTNDIRTVQNILMYMDRPFLFEVWESSIKESERTKKDLFGTYYKNILLNYKSLKWNDSIFGKSNTYSVTNNDNYNDAVLEFKITDEMIMRWGQNHDKESYMKLEEFYHKMKAMNKIETPQEEEYLKKLAVISLKMDQELENGNYDQVKKLGDLFSKYMADSKFRASDKTEADKTGGIRNFGAIFAEVEKDGHIPPWEEYRKIKGLTQDIVDQTIMHIENFTLRLNRIDRMTEPPIDTPKLTEEDTTVPVGDI